MESLPSHDSYDRFPAKVEEHMEKPLSLCHEGDRVLIRKIMGNGGYKKRLLDLGFRKGKEITVVRYAPLRDPMEVMVGDSYISLRVDEAERITVTFMDTATDGE